MTNMWMVRAGEDAFLIYVILKNWYYSNCWKIGDLYIHHTGNLYQIFTYVKNKEKELEGNDIEISGMLLYARTNESIQPDSDYVMSGNRICVKNLDLNQDFENIRNQLDEIIEDTFGDIDENT